MSIREHILLVDDEKEIVELVAEFLGPLGAPILKAYSGEEALELMAKNAVFLVVTDYRMPGMNGAELARNVRQKSNRTSLLLLTGQDDSRILMDSMKSGIEEVFLKPIDYTKLGNRVKELLEKRKAEIAAEEEEMRVLRGVFCEEAQELFRDIDQYIFKLEEVPDDSSNVDLLFRKAHTLKGSAGAFAGTEKITKFTHAYEQMLVSLKGKQIVVSPLLIDSLLQGSDLIRQMVDSFAANEESAVDVEPHVFAMNAIASGKVGGAKSAEGSSPAAGATVASRQDKKSDAEEDEGIVVSNEKLASFMELSGELVVFKNTYNVIMRGIMALEQCQAYRQQVEDITHALNKISEQIQNQIMDIRKVELKIAFSKFSRVIRSLNQDLGKNIRLEKVGLELEVDKTIAKSLAACLVHIIRNSADHGIEMPDTRVKNGKSDTGTIRLHCSQVGDYIHVLVNDDGQGIRADKVLSKALEKGLIDKKTAQSLSPQEIYDLLFLPGFSTAEKVTNVSGRGVGMDVVRTEIAKLGGTVELTSDPGKGTQTKISVPVPKTVLVENAILAESSEHLIAIPLTSIATIASCRDLKINNIHGELSCQFEEKTVPLGRLDRYVSDERLGDYHGLHDYDELIAIIITHKGKNVGLVVDRVVDQLEAVVRPFDGVVERVPGFRGTSLINDEKVAFVLSAEDLVELDATKSAA
jgi:two-component system, chemotaxis family, sensor kinase CheA